MNENEIFNLDNTEDLPEYCKKQIKGIHKKSRKSDKLLKLFEMKSQLSIDEIVVGYYRFYQIETTRNVISSRLFNLKKKKLIARVEGRVGFYEKC